jgi:DNA-binding transcriptional MerR regulator
MTSPPAEPWRIDDLAHRAGVTVDTVRYYQREGLLPEGLRAGRVKLYGPTHLERLERIRDLQGRGFSLAAIRTLLVADRGQLIEGIFADSDERRSYTLDEIIERSGVDAAFVRALRPSGLLRDPVEFGRDTYDSEDLDLLRTMGELARLGLPTKALVELGRIYAEGVEATQREVVDLFTTGGAVQWEPGELDEFQAAAATTSREILPLARRLVDYAHHRTIQRLTLAAIERGTISTPDAST